MFQGESFGELALLYNVPRAASILTKSIKKKYHTIIKTKKISFC